MPRWGYIPGRNQYRNLDTGKYVAHETIIEWAYAYADASSIGVDGLSLLVSNGGLGVDQWQGAMRQTIKTQYINQYVAGRGGHAQMTQRDWGAIGQMLRDQYRYLDDFASAVASGDLSDAEIRRRARMYIEAAHEAFERGRAESFGMPTLPAYPGDGQTSCLCIVSPEAPVLTIDGWKSLVDVRVGDLVFTHKKRWRKVTGVSVKPSQPEHRLSIVNGVAATDTHLWYTEDGWLDSNGIDNTSSPLYTLDTVTKWRWDDEDLSSMWWAYGQPANASPMQSMQIGVSLRELQGPSGCGVQVLRDVPQSKGSMGDRWRHFKGGVSQGWKRATHQNRKSWSVEMASARRWPLLELVLASRGRSKGNLIPVSVGLDYGAWANTGGYGDPSQEPHSMGRRSRKPGTFEFIRTLSATRQNCSRKVYEDHADMGVSGVRKGLSAIPTGSWRGAEVLQSDLLLGGAEKVALFDLTVEEDHSFCVNGIFAHNTNCRCNWIIKKVVKDEVLIGWNATWRLDQRAQHCVECPENAAIWAPLFVPAGMSVNEARNWRYKVIRDLKR